ncbi:MAG: 23S rRNA (adenine(2503)-C(2))-methyltransferase RlmN [Pseudomonadales bacterium]
MQADTDHFVSEKVTAESKVNVLGMTQARLKAFLAEHGEKPFRANQIMKWVHLRGVTDFNEMSDLAKPLRIKLSEIAEIRPPEVVSEHDSVDGTRKWIVRVDGGGLIETVYIPEKARGTLCVSSQVGCILDCSFCSTGKQGFQSDLSCAEIIGQVWLARKSLNSFLGGDGRVVTNVVFMGMGEPLLNYNNVMDACHLMMDDCGYGISKRRVTLSTSGVVPALEKMAGQTHVSLAISLHASNDELRNELVPINRKYPIKRLLEAVHKYMDSLPDRRRVVTIEYTLIKGVNDSDDQARELINVLKDTPCKINIIPFNPFPLSSYERPSNNRIDRFQKIVFEAGYIVTVRTTRGEDIDAACGQLVGQVADKTRRSERYQQKHAADVIRLVSL